MHDRCLKGNRRHATGIIEGRTDRGIRIGQERTNTPTGRKNGPSEEKRTCIRDRSQADKPKPHPEPPADERAVSSGKNRAQQTDGRKIRPEQSGSGKQQGSGGKP